MKLDQILEKGLLPDAIIRMGIRRLLKERLKEIRVEDPELREQRLADHVAAMDAGPIAIETDAAREQHYEVPTAFFQQVLGERLKYSSGFWSNGVQTLEQAEFEMLEITATRAGIEDGMRILDLGCGWGAMSLYLAERFPQCRIQAVSHSKSQIKHITNAANSRGLTNLDAQRVDANQLKLDGPFERIISVEMFEHMRNQRRLMQELSGLLTSNGKLFIHIFTHRESPYFFEMQEESDWMARYFFTGGMMPSRDLLLHFQNSLELERQWGISGIHYQKTLEAWLLRMGENRHAIMPILEATYGKEQARRWWNYWRIFFMACAELFGYAEGNEWYVSHYLFHNRQPEMPQTGRHHSIPGNITDETQQPPRG